MNTLPPEYEFDRTPPEVLRFAQLVSRNGKPLSGPRFPTAFGELSGFFTDRPLDQVGPVGKFWHGFASDGIVNMMTVATVISEVPDSGLFQTKSGTLENIAGIISFKFNDLSSETKENLSARVLVHKQGSFDMQVDTSLEKVALHPSAAELMPQLLFSELGIYPNDWDEQHYLPDLSLNTTQKKQLLDMLEILILSTGE